MEGQTGSTGEALIHADEPPLITRKLEQLIGIQLKTKKLVQSTAQSPKHKNAAHRFKKDELDKVDANLTQIMQLEKAAERRNGSLDPMVHQLIHSLKVRALQSAMIDKYVSA